MLALQHALGMQERLSGYALEHASMAEKRSILMLKYAGCMQDRFMGDSSNIPVSVSLFHVLTACKTGQGQDEGFSMSRMR